MRGLECTGLVTNRTELMHHSGRKQTVAQHRAAHALDLLRGIAPACKLHHNQAIPPCAIGSIRAALEGTPSVRPEGAGEPAGQPPNLNETKWN